MKNNIEIDQANDRIVAYLPNRDESVIKQLEMLQRQFRTTKTICYIKQRDARIFLSSSFVREGSVSGFFAGEKATVVSRFYTDERSKTKQVDKQKQTEKIVKQDKKDMSDIVLSTGYSIELLQKEDIEELAALYKTVFAAYPSNIFEPSYIQNHINENYFFIVAKHKGVIVSAASAMINTYGIAEITDCATDPEHRGQHLLHRIIVELEALLRKKKIAHAYSLTRALSTGMNLTIKRLGYTWEGTLVNNCIISTGFENMNIWSKSLLQD